MEPLGAILTNDDGCFVLILPTPRWSMATEGQWMVATGRLVMSGPVPPEIPRHLIDPNTLDEFFILRGAECEPLK